MGDKDDHPLLCIKCGSKPHFIETPLDCYYVCFIDGPPWVCLDGPIAKTEKTARKRWNDRMRKMREERKCK